MPDYELKTVLPKLKTNRFNFSLFKGKKDNQVLITPKAPSNKLIAEIDTAVGGATRLTKGVCYFENDQFVFATKSEPGPTWETITTKILKDHQCAKYLPVIFRKLGDNESEEVSAPEDGEVAPTSGEPSPVPPVGETPAPGTAPHPEIPTAPPPPPAPLFPEMEKIRQSSAAVWPHVKTALAAHPELKGEFSALLAAFQASLASGNADAAKQALTAVLLKLKSLGPAPVSPTNGDGPLVAYTKSRLEWQKARQQVRQELRKLEQTIINASQNEEDFEDITVGTSNLYAMFDRLDERLDDELDAALNAEAPEKRREFHAKAQKTITDYLAYVNSDPLLQEIDGNAFIGVAVHSTLSTTLARLAQTLNSPIGQN